MNRPIVRPILSLFSALALALTGGMPAARAAEPFVMTDAQLEAFGIELAAPESVVDAVSRRLPARVVVPNRQLRAVGAPQSGVIDQLLVATGDAVEAGQPLARLRSPDLLVLQREFLEAAARLELADSSFERDRLLYEEGIIAERRWQASRSERIGAEATLEQRRQRLQLAGFDDDALRELEQSGQLNSRLEVRAPMSGVVLEQMGTAGQRVDAAEPIYTLGQLDPLWLEIHVPLQLLPSLDPDGRMSVPDFGLEGRVVNVGRTVHDTDQGVLVRAEIRDPEGRLRPGQFVEATVCTDCGAGRSGYRVPRTAVVREAGAPFVFERTESGFAPQPVDVISEEDQALIIEVDLPAGTRIAVSGTAALKSYWLQQQEGG